MHEKPGLKTITISRRQLWEAVSDLQQFFFRPSKVIMLQLEEVSTKILLSSGMALIFLIRNSEFFVLFVFVFFGLVYLFVLHGIVQIQFCLLRKSRCPGKPLVAPNPFSSSQVRYFPLCQWVAFDYVKFFFLILGLLHPCLQGLFLPRMFSCTACSWYSSLFNTIAGKQQ